MTEPKCPTKYTMNAHKEGLCNCPSQTGSCLRREREVRDSGIESHSPHPGSPTHKSI